jgi:hypothetical protein
MVYLRRTDATGAVEVLGRSVWPLGSLDGDLMVLTPPLTC